MVSLNLEVKDSAIIEKVNYSYIQQYSMDKDNSKNRAISEKLTINFKNGTIFEYSPKVEIGNSDLKSFSTIFNELSKCESVGKYWHKNIKDKYQYKRLK